mmetsp:Transcript_2562/g.8779  ORF Transcript_2562/g.8779 Transcript_2562/m.8779 type:complete len:303 (+) Transcript_2562:782-1690(+)
MLGLPAFLALHGVGSARLCLAGSTLRGVGACRHVRVLDARCRLNGNHCARYGVKTATRTTVHAFWQRGDGRWIHELQSRHTIKVTPQLHDGLHRVRGHYLNGAVAEAGCQNVALGRVGDDECRRSKRRRRHSWSAGIRVHRSLVHATADHADGNAPTVRRQVDRHWQRRQVSHDADFLARAAVVLRHVAVGRHGVERPVVEREPRRHVHHVGRVMRVDDLARQRLHPAQRAEEHPLRASRQPPLVGRNHQHAVNRGAHGERRDLHLKVVHVQQLPAIHGHHPHLPNRSAERCKDAVGAEGHG